MFERLMHFLRFLWLIIKDIIFGIEFVAVVLLILVIPFCLGFAVGIWLQNYLPWVIADIIGTLLGFGFAFAAMMCALWADTYLEEKWKKSAKKPVHLKATVESARVK